MTQTWAHKFEQYFLIMFASAGGVRLRRIAPRQLTDAFGLRKRRGVESLLEQYKQVQAYHNNNYLPLLWDIHRQHRAALFRLLQLLSIRSATQDTSILDAIHQEKRVKYMNLVANIVILHNVFDLTKVLTEMNQDGYKVTPQLAKRLSPYMTEHIRRFGHYVIDMEDMPEPLQPQKLPFI